MPLDPWSPPTSTRKKLVEISTSSQAGGETMKPIQLNHGQPPVSSSDEIVQVIMKATNAQIAEKSLPDEEAVADFRLSTDALNYHRIVWRIREEQEEVQPKLVGNVRSKLCRKCGLPPLRRPCLSYHP